MQHAFSSSFVIYTIFLSAATLFSLIHAQILMPPGDVGEEMELKRSWNDFQGGYGKRAWNRFAGGYGKRANPEDELIEDDLLLNEKRAWNSGFVGGMGKRAWNSGFVGGMGKRAWNNGFTGGMGKRAWNSGYAGGMGKRAWNSGYAGGMGKRSMETDLANENLEALSYIINSNEDPEEKYTNKRGFDSSSRFAANWNQIKDWSSKRTTGGWLAMRGMWGK